MPFVRFLLSRYNTTMSWQLTDNPKPFLVYEPFAQEGVTAAVTTRAWGNFSLSIAPDQAEVRANRSAASEALGFASDHLIIPQQTHGPHSVLVTTPEHRPFSLDNPLSDCDALITATPGLLLGITIADCLPIFLFDPEQRVIALIHSGWRGTAAVIVRQTLKKMRDTFGTEYATVRAVIGPGISGAGYEVDSNVRSSFYPPSVVAPGVFTPTRPGHWHLDLSAANHYLLHMAGVPPENIALCPYHTDTHPDLFFSHRTVPGCPRMAAFMGLALTPRPPSPETSA
jgi:polyphenol oxidase